MPVPLLVIISVPAALSIPFIIYRFARPYSSAPETPQPTYRRPSTDTTPSVSSSEPRTPTPLMSPTEEGAMVWQTAMSAGTGSSAGRKRGRARGDSSESEEYVHFGRRIKTGLREKLGL